MSNVNYTACDICGKDMGKREFGSADTMWAYHIEANGYRFLIGSLFGKTEKIDLCESCWNRLVDEVSAARERDAS